MSPPDGTEPSTRRADEINLLGDVLALLMEPTVIGPFIISFLTHKAALNIRDPQPFQEAGAAWGSIADTLSSDPTGDSVESRIAAIKSDVQYHWEGSGAQDFVGFVDDELAPDLQDIGKALRSCADMCDDFAAALDTAYTTWKNGTVSAIQDAALSYVAAIVAVVAGSMSGALTALLGVCFAFGNFTISNIESLDSAVSRMKGRIDILEDAYSTVLKHFGSKAYAIQHNIRKTLELQRYSIETPDDWEKKVAGRRRQITGRLEYG